MTELTAAQWQLVKSLFGDLQDADAVKIEAALSAQPAAVRSMVESMLKSHRSSEHTITPQQSVADIITESERLRPGETFGKYRLLKPLGSGGMGDVYLAERSDEVTQKVAIKVMHRHLDEQGKARFDTERRILAQLEHPNIARLIDAGSEEGRAYCVMEYIDGEPIDAYCEHQGLGLKARLLLFLKVCEAVSFAHEHLVVHRDLKPSNILVTVTGEVKLLDFGIAKPLKTLPGTGEVQETVVGTTALTPQYSAPEQINGDAITVVCDVYVLGLLLYQLLTGEHALDLSGQSWGEIEQTIKENIPVLPSRRVLDSTKIGWGRALIGDLDSIVGYALRKEADRRYRSVRGLAGDVERYLQHDPIQIKHHDRWYRFQKGLRKHWLPISASGLIFGVLLVSSALIWQQSQVIKEERDKALIEQRIAEDVTDFLVDTFESADPTKALGTKLTAGDILQQGVKQLQNQNPDPRVKNRLLSTMARVYFNLSEFREAERLIGELETKDVRSSYLLARIKYDLGEPQTSMDLIESLEPKLIKGSEDYFDAMGFKVRLQDTLGEDLKAEQLSVSLLEDAVEIHGIDSVQHAVQLREYVKTIMNEFERPEGIVKLRQAVEILEKLPPQEVRLELLATMSYLGTQLKLNGKYEESLVLSETLEAEYKDYFNEDSLILAGVYSRRGSIYTNLKKPEKSLEYYQKSQDIYKKQLGEDATRFAISEFNMAIVNLYFLGEFEKAKALFESALSKVLLNNGKKTSFHYMQLPYAACLIQLNQYDVAKRVIAESVAHYEKNGHFKNARRLLGRYLLAHIMIIEGNYEAAKPLVEESKESVIRNYYDIFYAEWLKADLDILKEKTGENYE